MKRSKISSRLGVRTYLTFKNRFLAGAAVKNQLFESFFHLYNLNFITLCRFFCSVLDQVNLKKNLICLGKFFQNVKVFYKFYLLLFMFHNVQIYHKNIFKTAMYQYKFGKKSPLTIRGPATPMICQLKNTQFLSLKCALPTQRCIASNEGSGLGWGTCPSHFYSCFGLE